eukprot:3149472-Pyramimonas_sp.AAC.1
MRGNPLRPRLAGSPVCVRSGASAKSERDVLQTALMVNTDGQNAVRADEDTFENLPLTQLFPTWCEYASAYICQYCPVTEEEHQ